MYKIDVYEQESAANPWTVVLLDSSLEIQDDRIVMAMYPTEQEATDWIAAQPTSDTATYVIIEDTNLQRVGDRFRNFQGIDFENI